MYPDSKAYGAPVGPHVGPMNLAIWVGYQNFNEEAIIFPLHMVKSHHNRCNFFANISNEAGTVREFPNTIWQTESVLFLVKNIPLPNGLHFCFLFICFLLPLGTNLQNVHFVYMPVTWTISCHPHGDSLNESIVPRTTLCMFLIRTSCVSLHVTSSANKYWWYSIFLQTEAAFLILQLHSCYTYNFEH